MCEIVFEPCMKLLTKLLLCFTLNKLETCILPYFTSIILKFYMPALFTLIVCVLCMITHCTIKYDLTAYLFESFNLIYTLTSNIKVIKNFLELMNAV